jgi:hypothetical protein
MDELEIQALVSALDTSRSIDEETAWLQLKTLGADVVPHLVAFYPRAKKWQGRASLVFHSIRYARVSEEAFQLGISALNDKSRIVRHRACSLCAYSLRQDAVPVLASLFRHNDPKTVEDAQAAIDAIRHKNHHYFYDRTHSGRSQWIVNDQDRVQV